MSFHKFNVHELKLLPLAERKHDIDISCFIKPGDPVSFEHPALEKIADAIREARKKDASVIMMYGAHVVRSGCMPLMIDLMKRGLITHFATNGAGAIHDYELARMGRTCESVARYTWAIEAEPIGSGSMLANSSSGGRPKSSSMTGLISSKGAGVTASRRFSISKTYCGGNMSGRIEMSCPSLMKAGPSSSKASRSSRAKISRRRVTGVSPKRAFAAARHQCLVMTQRMCHLRARMALTV